MDKPGKKILIKFDSGPSQSNNVVMCARLRNLWLYLYSKVLNITSVSQETDCGYGNYKTVSSNNIVKLSVN